jgi:hypothetical protein
MMVPSLCMELREHMGLVRTSALMETLFTIGNTNETGSSVIGC